MIFLNTLDIKVLTYISRRKSVSNAILEKKFGIASRIMTENLEKVGYIESPPFSDGVQFGFSVSDKWNITALGSYFLKNNKAQRQLTSKERLFNYFLGFGSGIISGCLIQLFIRLL